MAETCALNLMAFVELSTASYIFIYQGIGNAFETIMSYLCLLEFNLEVVWSITMNFMLSNNLVWQLNKVVLKYFFDTVPCILSCILFL
jgi:hypothetical protein